MRRTTLRSIASRTRTVAAVTSERSVRYSYHGEATVVVPSAGHRMYLDAGADLDPDSLQHFVLQPGLAAILHARGWLVLHASAVQVGGRAVAFAGRSEAGKSSIAAALALRGHALLSEEVTPVVVRQARAFTLAGPPQASLDPSAALALSLPVENLRPVYPGSQKLALSVQQPRPKEGPIPLAVVYILEPSGRAGIERLAGQQKIIGLVQNSYWAGFFDRGGLGRNLRDCAEAAGGLEVRRLSRTRDVSDLTRIAEMVEMDVVEMDVNGA